MTLILNKHYVWRLLKLEEVVYTCLSYQQLRYNLNYWGSFDIFLWAAVRSKFPSYSAKVPRVLWLDADFQEARTIREIK